MQNNKHGRGISATRRLVLCAVFAALAYAVMFVFRFNVQFLTFDLKDAVITVAGLLLGPVAALTISLLVALLEMITVGDTGIYGAIMNFASSATFSVVAALVYRYRRRLSGAIMGLGASVLSLVGVMMLLNLLITPLYTGMTAGDVAGMIPALLLPFNAVKALSNAALVLILYKPISRAMSAAGFLPRARALPAAETNAPALPQRQSVWVSVAVMLAGVLLLTGAILFFRFVLGGRFELF